MRRFLRENGLSLAFLALFLGSLAGQAIAGHAEYNNEEVDVSRLSGDQPDTISLGRYLTSSHFWRAVMENWQSEYLQFTMFLILTVWLVQKGSVESKELGQGGPRKRRGAAGRRARAAQLAALGARSAGCAGRSTRTRC